MLPIIEKYFPLLDKDQKLKLENLALLLKDWNEKINVISRKDIDNIEIHHILHSLGIAKFLKFTPDTKILDLGTGGGLPGIPLAILFPDVDFHLIDRVGKKILVADDIAEKLDLKNVTCEKIDLNENKNKYDFLINRGVMSQIDIIKLSRKNISDIQRNALPNGIISLKGGDLTQEIGRIKNKTEIIDLKNYFDEPFFETKKIVYTPV